MVLEQAGREKQNKARQTAHCQISVGTSEIFLMSLEETQEEAHWLSRVHSEKELDCGGKDFRFNS